MHITWPIDFTFLGNIDCDTLRRLKVALSEAKGGTTGHQMFRYIDRMLTDREGTTHFKTAKAGECVSYGDHIAGMPAPSGTCVVRVEERDLAHESDMRTLRKKQLREDITPEEAREELEYDHQDVW